MTDRWHLLSRRILYGNYANTICWSFPLRGSTSVCTASTVHTRAYEYRFFCTEYSIYLHALLYHSTSLDLYSDVSLYSVQAVDYSSAVLRSGQLRLQHPSQGPPLEPVSATHGGPAVFYPYWCLTGRGPRMLSWQAGETASSLIRLLQYSTSTVNRGKKNIQESTE